ncbi:hypothetical protein [Endozoicomonas numazuensis]|uniref:Uncharacterized protein n=1 Tax=Endozoicomonas numazuensis TaxID=1137799 RepID=A0A081NEF7_9GAMM|nr:hypothetical protein [Endozoicomonas numazuensis]KEQ16830.1 hypothetical protein GZ78_19375 [Endozoicomonas numazuensis]
MDPENKIAFFLLNSRKMNRNLIEQLMLNREKAEALFRLLLKFPLNAIGIDKIEVTNARDHLPDTSP